MKQIFNGLHSPDYRKAVYDQVVDDSAGGFDDSAIALFGKPGTGKFEFVFTGRHVTRRCDGDSLEGAEIAVAETAEPFGGLSAQDSRDLLGAGDATTEAAAGDLTGNVDGWALDDDSQEDDNEEDED